MPLCFSAHTIACLTKQDLRRLMQELMAATEVKFRRAVASQLGGRMLTEIEAPDQKTLENWFGTRWMHCEWIMRIDLDAKDGTVTEY